MTALADMDARTRHPLRDSFFAAARLGQTDDLRTMLTHYPELLNAKDDADGATALILAADNGHILSVKLLVENKADIFLTDSADRNALYAAAQKGCGLIAVYLVEEGLDPDDKGEVGLSPAGIAAAKGYSTVVDLMQATRDDYLLHQRVQKALAAAALAQEVKALGEEVQAGTKSAVVAPGIARFKNAPRP